MPNNEDIENNQLPENEDELLMDLSLNKKRAERIQDNIDKAYQSIYYTDNQDSNAINAIRRQMDYSINGLIDKTKLATGHSNMSKIYAQTLAQNDDSLMRELSHTLQDESMLADIMDLYSQNMITRDMDREIDVVCKYMPKLEEALDIKADHVLTADHFNRDNIRINVLNSLDPKDTNDNDKQESNSESTIESFKRKYDLTNLSSKIYKKTAKYGETYVYVISYNKALSRLLQRSSGQNLLTESGLLSEDGMNTILNENSINLDFTYYTPLAYHSNMSSVLESGFVYEKEDSLSKEINKKKNSIIDESTEENSIKVEINTTGVIPSVVSQQSNLNRILQETSTLFEARNVKLKSDLRTNFTYTNNINDKIKKYSKDFLQSPTDFSTSGGQDGFTDINPKNKVGKIDIPGCIVEELEHTMVKPLYIRNIPLGYYYIESDTPLDVNEQTTFSSTLGGLRPRRSTRDRENMTSQQTDNAVLLKIAKQISQKIDAKFINANQDLAQEIYTILKFNADHANGKVSKIRISFIPPEDIIHSFFDLNEKTHRGKSDLERSLFPAKLYSCLYISNTIALLTRGYDKRVYHVRQAVDTNITAVLLNVINQIKQSNFNLRQIENMNNILNIIGRFNDLVIPQNANGESPVSFEVMPGQNVDVKTEFMNMLEEMSINQTGVSLEMVNSRQMENTATHITMTNTRFLIKIFNRQIQYQSILSRLFTKIYQNEYNNNNVLEVELPPPVMLNFTNTSQIIAVANELIQNILTMKMGTEQDEQIKQAFLGKLMRFYFKSFLPLDEIDKMADDARVDIEVKRQQQDQGMGNDMGGGGQPMY